MNYQPIFNIAAICAAHNITDAVLSPGSRNAPLIYAFARNEAITSYSISDERSAGFIALGMALKIDRPVVLVCTSGSAVYNYAPAIAEAYYENIPLIVITADRPPEWLNQFDGQTINQNDIYRNHVKKSFHCPVDLSDQDAVWHFERIINEALITATDGARGPVHINVPFREPFYPGKDDQPGQSPAKIIRKLSSSRTLEEFDWVNLVDDWRKREKRLIVGGQDKLKDTELEVISEFAGSKNIPLVGDVLSNLHGLANTINLADTFMGALDDNAKEKISPDLLITFGKSTISKNVKLLLRKFKPKNHWHIQEEGDVADTFQSLTRIIPVSPVDLFRSIDSIAAKGSVEYLNQWSDLQLKTRKKITRFAEEQDFNEFSAVYAIFDNLPLACDIHLANSMPVRWANLFGLDHTKQQIEIFCNRGTSGIDGCTSTAVGSAIQSDKTTLLITGDMAFFYDRNAFWNKYIPDNLRIIVLNNHGGGIFDIIDGPSSHPEHEEYFLTEQNLSPKSLAEEFGLKYYHCQSVEGLSKGLDKFWIRDGSAKLLEIETDIKTNTRIFKQLKKELRQELGKE